MSVSSVRVKNGVHYANFGCSANHFKGAASCPNNLNVSERKVTSAVLGALQDLLTSPEVIARFVDRFNDRLAQKRVAAMDTAALERGLATADKALANLADAVGHAGWSETLGQRLQAQEMLIAALRERKKALADATRSGLAPHPRVVAEYLQNLNRTLAKEPEKARGLLHKHLGPVHLTPKAEGPDRHYLAVGAFDLSVFDRTSCGGGI